MKTKKKKYTVTTYDGFGDIAEIYQADEVGWHGWHTCELDKSICLNMPAIIVEKDELEGEWLQMVNADYYPHEIILLSFDNKIIKKWLSEFPPAHRCDWVQFTSDRHFFQVKGCTVIKRIEK